MIHSKNINSIASKASQYVGPYDVYSFNVMDFFGRYKIITLFLVCIILTFELKGQPTSFIPHGPGGGGYMYSPSISPHNPQLIFINCDMGGLYRSADGGKSFQLISSDLVVTTIKGKVQFTSDPNTLYICRRSRTNLEDPLFRGELAVSLDAGLQWQKIPDPTSSGIHRIEVDPNSTQRIILSEYDRLFFTSDAGKTWTTIYKPNDGQIWLAGVYWNDNEIYVGLDKGLLISKNNGSSFDLETHKGLPNNAGLFQLSGAKSLSSLHLFCSLVTNNEMNAWLDPLAFKNRWLGIYKLNYTDSAEWESVAGNLPNSFMPSWIDLAKNNTQIVWTAGADSMGLPMIFKSVDGGLHWKNTFLLDHNENIETGWAGHEGAFWLYYNEFPLGFDVSDVDPNHVIETGGNGHETKDGGLTWTADYVQSNNLNALGQSSKISGFYASSGLDVTSAHQIFWKNEKEIFVCNTDIGQTYSNDGGNHWTFANNIFFPWGSVAYNNWYRIVRHPLDNDFFAAVSEVNDIYSNQRITDQNLESSGGLILKSKDEGNHWDTLHDFKHPVVWLEINKKNPNQIYASVVHHEEGGIYQSNDRGTHWFKMPSPPRTEGHPYNIISLDDGSLVASYAAHDPNNDGVLSASSGVYYLPSGSNQWMDRSDAAMIYYTKDVVIDPHDKLQNTWYATVWGRNTIWPGPNNQENGGLYVTKDRGQNWKRIFTRNTPESITINPSQANIAYVTVENDGLYYTDNLNANADFKLLNAFPWWRPKRVFFNPFDPCEIWLTTMGGGIWSSKILPCNTNTVNNSNANDISFEITSQPSNEAINIQFQSNKENSIHVNLFNSAQQEIAKHQIKINSGLTNFRLDYRHMTSGIYFLKISSVQSQWIRKIVLH